MNVTLTFELALDSVGFRAHAEVAGLDPSHVALFDERWPRAEAPSLDGVLRFDVVERPVGLAHDVHSAAEVRWIGPDEAHLRATSADLTVAWDGRRMHGRGSLHAPHSRTALEAAFRAVSALALARRGIGMLHASAVARGHAAAVFLGESEAGKTTTARRLGREGFERLADDMIAVDLSGAEPTLHPLAFDRAAADAMRTQRQAPPFRCIVGARVRKGAPRAHWLEIAGPVAVRVWSDARIALPSPPRAETALLDQFQRLCAVPLVALDVPPSGPISEIVGSLLERFAVPGNPIEAAHGVVDAGAIWGKDPAVAVSAAAVNPAKDMQIRRAPNVAWRVIDEAAVLVVPSSPNLQTLNPVGTRVWELADGRPLSDIVDAVVNEFEVTRNQAMADVQAFVRDLADKGLLQLSEPTP